MAPTVIYTEPSGCVFQSWCPEGIHALAQSITSTLHFVLRGAFQAAVKDSINLEAFIWSSTCCVPIMISPELFFCYDVGTLLEGPGRIWDHVKGQAMKIKTIPCQPFPIHILNINWKGLGIMWQFVALFLVPKSLHDSSQISFIKWKNAEKYNKPAKW